MREMLPKYDKLKKGSKMMESALATGGKAQEGREANRGRNKNVTRDGDGQQATDV